MASLSIVTVAHRASIGIAQEDSSGLSFWTAEHGLLPSHPERLYDKMGKQINNELLLISTLKLNI